MVVSADAPSGLSRRVRVSPVASGDRPTGPAHATVRGWQRGGLALVVEPHSPQGQGDPTDEHGRYPDE
jgi:hypothetical protein